MSNIQPSDLTPADREYHFFLDPNRMDHITLHVANGGSLIDIAKGAMIPYSKIMAWIRADKVRLDKYTAALDDRREWAKESVLSEIRSLGMFDIRKLLNDNGKIKPVSEWPDEIARAVVGIDVSEEYEGFGDERHQSGWLKKIKTVDKLKSLEMVAKNLSLLIEKHDVRHEVTLDQLIMSTQKSKPDEIK
jgi:hypothetical protein